jgi:hypothetical protein
MFDLIIFWFEKKKFKPDFASAGHGIDQPDWNRLTCIWLLALFLAGLVPYVS